ncbi:MAG: hypothetical protein IH940_14475 [Acidobacteria bacterium]|nr:hypothetical protein [Acidobacteriota bacterium]
MKLVAVLLGSVAAAAVVISSNARRKLARCEACTAWLALQDEPDETSVVIYTDRPTAAWVDTTISDTQWRGHEGLTMDLVLSDAVALGPCAGVVVCAGERDLRHGVPIADVVGDLARLHDHLCSIDASLQVIAVPRPWGRWGPAIDNLNGEFTRLCSDRNVALLDVDDDLASLIANTTPG